MLSGSRCYISALPIAAPSLSVQQACAGAGARDGQPTAAPPRRGGWGRSRCPPARGSGLGRVGHRRSRRPGLRHGTPVGARSAWCALYPLPLALSLPSSPSLSRSPSLALARWLRVRRLSSIAGVRARPFGAGAAAPEGRASTAAPPLPLSALDLLGECSPSIPLSSPLHLQAAARTSILIWSIMSFFSLVWAF